MKQNTLDVLKENVDRLPRAERELIAINDNCMLLNVPTDVEINVDQTEGNSGITHRDMEYPLSRLVR